MLTKNPAGRDDSFPPHNYGAGGYFMASEILIDFAYRKSEDLLLAST
jgi:hypothetical protein